MTSLAAVPPAYWLPPLVTGTTTAALAILVWLVGASRAAVTLSLYLFSVALWSVGYCLQLHSTALAEQVFWSKVQYIGPAGMSLAGLIFVLQYCGFQSWVRPRRLFFLGIIPALTQLLVWTNEKHGLIWSRVWEDTRGPYAMMARTHGVWFWVFLMYSYGLCVVSMFFLFRVLLRRPGIYRYQAAVMLVGCMIPFAGNVFFSFGYTPVPNLDLTVFGFSITGASMAWGLFRFQLPTLMPVAQETVFEGMTDGVVVLDPSGAVAEVNAAAAAIFSLPARKLIGRPATSAFAAHPEFAGLCGNGGGSRDGLTIAGAGGPRRFEVRCSPLEQSRLGRIGSLVVLRDVTEREAAAERLREMHAELERRVAERTVDLDRTIEELRLAQDRLSYSAYHDGLTGLPNRKLFLERLSSRIGSSTDGLFAVLYLDVDRFKVYNDGSGHDTGDLILVEMARRLRACFRETDTAARMGGDEFTILLDNLSSVEDAVRLARRCRDELAKPARIGNHEIHLSVSIGIAPGVARQTAEEILRDSDIAMYRAKRLGGDQIVLFDESMRSSAVTLLRLAQELHLALERDEIAVFYQPIVHLGTRTIVGFEALVRWRHPERGLLPPSEFLHVAEQTGLIMTIDETVLQEACRQRARWASAAVSRAQAPFVTVNISSWPFSHPQRWWQGLTRALAISDDCASGLRLEITEQALIANAHASTEFFRRLRAYNLPIYLDDFGTGYSSLAWISRFSIHSLKIDRSFVGGMVVGGKDLSIIRGIIAMARSLCLEVVAEGVETPRQWEILEELGCEYCQGFYFSRPVDSEEAFAMVRGKLTNINA